MKMIRSTSITSTIGVTLISELYSLVPPMCAPILILPGKAARRERLLPLASQRFRTLLDKVIDQLRSRVFHFDTETRHFVREIIEEPHGGHRHGDTKCSSDKGFRDCSTNRT